jgi:hypothetical protein
MLRLRSRADRLTLAVLATAATAGGALTTATARADETDRPERPEASAIHQAVEDGAFAALAMPARVGSTRAFAWGLSGYDGSRKSAVVDAVAEVHLAGPVALRGAATYDASGRRMRPSIGARVQLLRQESHALDGALSVFYRAEGFTEGEGEIETFLSLGRRFDRLSVNGSLVYGQDPEGNERDGEARAAAFRQVGRFSLGLDSRVRFAIGPQHGKAGAAPEPTFDALAGATASATLGTFAVFAEVGPSAFKMKGTDTRLGATAFGGLGAAF